MAKYNMSNGNDAGTGYVSWYVIVYWHTYTHLVYRNAVSNGNNSICSVRFVLCDDICISWPHTNKNMALMCKLVRNPNATPDVTYTKCAKCAAWSLDGCTNMNGAVFVGTWRFVCT